MATRAFGANLGLAFQLVDDLLGIWGDPARTGKPVCSDLRSRKKSIPVVAALNSGSAEGRQLATSYAGGGELSDHDLARLAALIDSAGGRQWCQDQADLLLGTALEAVESDEFTTDTGDLAALATYLAGRGR